MTVKSFSPVLLEIFTLGSEKEFSFDCKTSKAAKKLQARLHYLRREMRREHHWMIPIAEKVIVSVRGSKLIAHPPDFDIEKALHQALVEQGLSEKRLGK